MDNTEEFRIMTHCCHNELYKDCIYGCELWKFSRTYRRHIVRDDNCYREGCHAYLWEICSAAPYSTIQGKYGYDLYYKGKLIKHGKTVKELKETVISLAKSEARKKEKDGY